MGDDVILKSGDNIEFIERYTKKYLYKYYGTQDDVELINNDGIYKIRFSRTNFERAKHMIAYCVIRCYVVFFTENYLRCNYEGILGGELDEMSSYALEEILRSDDGKIIFSTESILLDFAERFAEINIDGILIFAFREYENELCELFENYIDAIIAEEEMNSFVSLLKDYVMCEPSHFGTLHVVILENGSYKYLDNNKNDITQKCLKEFYDETNDDAAQDDDILISILVIMQPERIEIHNLENSKNKNLINTICEIFNERVKICSE